MGTTAIIALVLQLVEAAATSGPAFIIIAQKGREIIDALFTAKLISADQQLSTKAYVDAVEAMVNAGIVPDHWKVEPDPEGR